MLPQHSQFSSRHWNAMKVSWIIKATVVILKKPRTELRMAYYKSGADMKYPVLKKTQQRAVTNVLVIPSVYVTPSVYCYPSVYIPLL